MLAECEELVPQWFETLAKLDLVTAYVNATLKEKEIDDIIKQIDNDDN